MYPTIIVPNPITNAFICSHRDYIFVYGYDLMGKGALGQCVVAKDEINCFPVYTTRNGCKSSGFFQDSMIEEIKKRNIEAIAKILDASGNKLPIIPFPKIGRGHSRMFEFAKESYKWLMNELNAIAYPKIDRVYTNPYL